MKKVTLKRKAHVDQRGEELSRGGCLRSHMVLGGGYFKHLGKKKKERSHLDKYVARGSNRPVEISLEATSGLVLAPGEHTEGKNRPVWGGWNPKLNEGLKTQGRGPRSTF